MSDHGVSNGVPPNGGANRKSGWYRDRKTGQRRFWNGAAWTDLSSAITPFTVEPEPVVAPPSAPPTSPAPKSRTRTRIIVASVVVLLGAVAIVLAVILSSGTTIPARSVGPSPLVAPASSLDEPTSTTVVVPTTAPTTTVATSPAKTLPPAVPAGVAIIGDSISVLSTPAIERAFHHNGLFFDAILGSHMADHLSTIQRIESQGIPRDWVIELGTNDALGNPLDSSWQTDFANEVAALRTQPCVVFVTVNPNLGSISTGINQAIAGAVASHPNFHSVDWGTIEFRKAQWLLPDHLHPSASGSAELARLEHKAILDCAA